MRKKSLLIALVLTFTIGALLVGCTNDNSSPSNDSQSENEDNDSTNSESVNLSLGHVVSSENHYHVFATKLQELVSEKSNGSISIDVFPQGQLGDEVTMFQAAQSGTLDLLVIGQSAMTNTIKELGIFDLPYLFDSVDQANEILAGDIGDKYLDIISDHDVVGLGYLSAMERNVFSNKPINDISDFNGLKLRVSQVPSYIKTFETLGAQPTPMSFDEVYLGLQQGVVDGASAPPDVFINDKFVEVADYYNFTKAFYLPAVAIASQNTWDQLTQEQQDIIMESVKEALPESIDYYKEGYDKYLKEAEDAGTEIIETDLTEIKEKASEVYEVLLKDIPNGEELFEEIQNETFK